MTLYSFCCQRIDIYMFIFLHLDGWNNKFKKIKWEGRLWCHLLLDNDKKLT